MRLTYTAANADSCAATGGGAGKRLAEQYPQHGALPKRLPEVERYGPCRDRTYDQEIKSLLLYQLS